MSDDGTMKKQIELGASSRNWEDVYRVQTARIAELEADLADAYERAAKVLPDTIIAGIIEDIKSRKGLRQEWDSIDVDIRNEIAHEWREFIQSEIRALKAPALDTKEE